MPYFKTATEKNVFIIPANFLTFNFIALQNEYAEKHHITWEIPQKASHRERPGDICYFYYTHLPSAAGATQSRILMRGIVEQGPHKRTKGDIYDTNDSCQVDAITLTDLQPIQLKDYEKYSWENIKGYGFFSPIQSIQQLKTHQADLYYHIEQDIQNDPESELLKKSKTGFAKLIAYFETPCFFQESLHPQKDPLTFIRRNGLRYYDSHHFIPQFTEKKINNSEFSSIVKHHDNRVALCPYCHKRIHLGTSRDVSQMLEAIYAQKKDKSFLKDISLYIGTNDILAWLKNIYAVNSNDEEDLLECIE
jgi:hypothetical protein